MVQLCFPAHQAATRSRAAILCDIAVNYSPLQAAARHGHGEIVKLLINHNSAINMVGGHHGTALNAAVCRMKKEIVELLLDNGANVNINAGGHEPALHDAALRGNTEIVMLLLDHGANVNLNGGKYATAFQIAVVRGNRTIMKLLISKGAEINARGGHYGSALGASCTKGLLQFCQVLIESGADVNIKSFGEYGNPLECALICENLEIVELLLLRGAKVEQISEERTERLERRCRDRNKPVFEFEKDPLKYMVDWRVREMKGKVKLS